MSLMNYRQKHKLKDCQVSLSHICMYFTSLWDEALYLDSRDPINEANCICRDTFGTGLGSDLVPSGTYDCWCHTVHVATHTGYWVY